MKLQDEDNKEELVVDDSPVTDGVSGDDNFEIVDDDDNNEELEIVENNSSSGEEITPADEAAGSGSLLGNYINNKLNSRINSSSNGESDVTSTHRNNPGRRSNYLTDKQMRERAEEDPTFDINAAKKNRDNEANTNAVRTAADVAEKSGNPIAAGIGKGVKEADKVTGGKASEKLGERATKDLKRTPGGRDLQNKVNVANAAMNGDFEGAKNLYIEGVKKSLLRRFIAFLPTLLIGAFVIGSVAVALMFIIIFLQNTFSGLFRFPYLPNNFSNFITLKDSSGGSQNIDIDTYVASVLYAEVGEFSSSEETLKAQAVAARTYALYYMQHQGYIGNGTNYQVSKMIPEAIGENTIYMKAATETSGVVLANNGSIFMSQYDAFAANEKCGGGEDDNNYILCQQGLKIPKEWARSNGLSDSTAAYYNKHFHGQGMSQWGAYYLAKAEGRDFEYILNYFYPDAQLMSIYEYSIDPLNAENTSSNTELSTPLGEFLKNHGSSMKALNDEILMAVLNYGPGTGAGVAAAAVTLISTMDQQFNVKIPYYWGGGQGAPASHNFKPWDYYGANKYWGEYNCTYANNKAYCYIGLDCAGFVTWAIHTGGVKIYDTQTFYQKGKEVSVYNGNQASPGDILKHPGHIMLVLSYDSSNQTYKVAEAAGWGKGVRICDKSVSWLNDNSYHLYLMGDAYKKNAVENYEEKFQAGRID